MINSVKVEANCALDIASIACWVNERVLKRIGLHAEESCINVTTMVAKIKVVKTEVINNLIVKGLDLDITASITVVYSKCNKERPFAKDDLVTTHDKAKFPHLNNVPFHLVDTEIDLLIGMDMPQLVKLLEVIDGPLHDPFAMKFSLGWAFCGPISRFSFNHACHRVSIDTASASLDDEVETYLSREFADSSCERSLSRNNLN